MYQYLEECKLKKDDALRNIMDKVEDENVDREMFIDIVVSYQLNNKAIRVIYL